MAKIIFNEGEISGKLGGKVYSRNRWGAYVRELAIPVQPQTSYQVQQRGRISTNADAWRDLSESERLEWAGYANMIARTDRLGQPLSYNGFTAFMLLNTERLVCGTSALTTPPTTWEGIQPDGMGWTVNNAAIDLTIITSGGVGLGTTGTHYVECWSCAPGSLGRTTPTGLRMFKVIGPGVAFPVSLTNDWVARFGAIQDVAGLRYFLGIKLVNVVDPPTMPSKGYVSILFQNSVLSTT